MHRIIQKKKKSFLFVLHFFLPFPLFGVRCLMCCYLQPTLKLFNLCAFGWHPSKYLLFKNSSKGWFYFFFLDLATFQGNWLDLKTQKNKKYLFFESAIGEELDIKRSNIWIFEKHAFCRTYHVFRLLFSCLAVYFFVLI